MVADSPKYVVESGPREKRCKNIALAILELRETHKKVTGVATDRLRAHIRAKLALPSIIGEMYYGDLRAHGDALGGHGLKLTVVRESKKRVVKFTEENLKICRDYIAGNKGEESGTLF